MSSCFDMLSESRIIADDTKKQAFCSINFQFVLSTKRNLEDYATETDYRTRNIAQTQTIGISRQIIRAIGEICENPRFRHTCKKLYTPVKM